VALIEKEHPARTDAERVTAQLRHVLAVTDTTLLTLEPHALMRELLARVRAALASDTAAILLLEPDGRHLTRAAFDGLEKEIGEQIRIPLGQGTAGRIATSDHGVVFEDLGAIDEIKSLALPETIKSLVAAPLRVGSRLIGVIYVGAVTPRQFTDADLGLLSLVGERAALAIERGRLHVAERSAEEKFRLAVEAAPTAMIMVDAQGAILLVNALTEQLFGYAREELLGQSIEQLVPLRFRDRHPELRASFFTQPRRRPMGAGRELYALRKDGREVPVEIGLSPFETTDGVFVLAAITDITERRRVEQRQAAEHGVTRILAESPTLEDAGPKILQTVCEGLGWDAGALWMVDRDAGVLRCVDVWHLPAVMVVELETATRERTFTRGVGLPGRVWANGEPAWIADLAGDDDFLRALFASKEARHGASGFPIGRVGDVHGVIEFFCRELRPPDRELVAMMGNIGSQIGQFIERQRAEEERRRSLVREQTARQEAEAANRSKDEFLAMLSHELRTPLNAILGWANMLRAGTLDEATMGRAFEAIERNTKVQAQLLEDLLDASRIVSGKLHVDVRPVDLVRIAETAIDAVRPAADAKGIVLAAALDPSVGPVAGDPGRLQQTVWNLLSNAIKFTPREGRVEIQLTRLDSRVQIIVSDTGSGISPDFLPHVFDRFRQAASARPHGGLGIGLAIVRHIVELHGGAVEAASPGEGQGATFTVTFPAMPDRPDARDAAEAPPAITLAAFGHPGSLTGVRVLVVDDEADARELFTAVLERQGAEVRTSAAAREAFELLRSWRPDVLVSDIEMPDDDGYTLIQQVRALPPESGGRIPAVALTAYARVTDRSRALREGFHLHVTKPVEPAELAAAVANLAGRTGLD
jgi:PAS domain S-box-containing protein